MIPRLKNRSTCVQTTVLGLILTFVTCFGAGCAGANAGTPGGIAGKRGTLSTSASSLDFGALSVGSSKTLVLKLTNTAAKSATIQVSQINMSGSEFAASGATPPITLAAGSSVSLNVTFQPTSGGTASGSLSIVSNAADPTVTVPLSGSALTPGQLAVTPQTVNFGNVTVGNSQSQTGTLTAGGSSVTVSSASWNGAGFAVSGIHFPVSVGAGQSVPFTISFTPQNAGSVTGTVSFLSDASNSPTNEQLSGTGTQPMQHIADVSWNPSTSSVQGYYVYRGAQSGGPYGKISGLIPALTYADATVTSGQTYYYVVTALGTDSVESGYSAEVAAMIP